MGLFNINIIILKFILNEEISKSKVLLEKKIQIYINKGIKIKQYLKVSVIGYKI